ncbi:hypothetical protein BJ322DRAFT_827783 [Thelephora terrestris]|uniref:Zn(2)-C6 fungal-type domain-containing protein n=1 Tax=Thelephora terrestris TaxID=56493 RepID=A0A9P6HF14_9AGAM|nr:hypothetical protein BJ322DRAFT_827783 [Thelephora terrestris]
MATKGACLPCRIRKVRCVRGPQRCERCTAQGITDCVYEGVKKRGTGNTLRMGQACKRCRTRKRKCDAKRPCTTCVEANDALDCEYEKPFTGPRLFDRPLPSVSIEPLPSSSRSFTSQGHRALEEVVQRVPTRRPVATSARSGPEGVPPERALVHSFGLDDIPHSPFPNGAGTQGPRLPPFSVLSAFLLSKISPEPHLTLSQLGAERFLPSDPAICALALKFRLTVVCRLNKLGIHLSPKKQQALLDGDTSGTVLHPFLIPAVHSLGMHFCEGVGNSFTMVSLQARYVQQALEQLTEFFKETDRRQNWELRALIMLWITIGSIVMRPKEVTFVYLGKACDAVNRGGLRFIPAYGRPPEFSEDLRETFSILSQTIYFENFTFLVYNGARPTMTARIEWEFRHTLPV